MICTDCGEYSWADNGGHEIDSSCCEHCLVNNYIEGGL
jgi:hypothetical protein